MNTTNFAPFVLALVVFASGCQPASDSSAMETAAVAAADAVPAASQYQRHDWPLPAPVGAAQPDLLAIADGRLLLSWVEPVDDGGHRLQLATFTPMSADAATSGRGQWSTPVTVASGRDWFVNWADTPHVVMADDGALWAHWLQKSAEAGYAYDVALVRSGDGGSTWSEPVLVNDDGTPTEHGFVSLWPSGGDGIGIAWLDGRATASGGHAGHAGAMSLRSAHFNAALDKSGEVRIDAMTCDCCQTDIAVTARGPLLVYRDRNADEIRDIAVTRFEDGRWTPPRLAHADQWTMPACPVNGPSVAARGDHVVLGWYTAADDVPTLRLAVSGDAGDTFSMPLTLDQGEAVQGRVAVALDDDAAWAVWAREDKQGQSLQLTRHAPGLERELQRVELAALAGRGRGTGFPKLALLGGDAHVVWTDVVDGRPRLQGAVLAAGE
ncbi:MAG: sialidase family protein [Lysobacter sp.]